MIYLLGLTMILFAYLAGRGALILLYGKKGKASFCWEDCLVTGWMIGIGLAEAAHLGTLVGGRSFSDGKLIFLGLVIAVTVVAVVLRLRERTEPARRFNVLRENAELGRKGERITSYLLLLMILLAAIHMVMEPALFRTGDLTVEQVNTMLSTNGIKGINPATGRAYTTGMPARLQILCLPSLYGFLCAVSGLQATSVVWTLIPVCTLLFTMVSYSALGGALSPEGKKEYFAVAEKRLFLILTLFLMLTASYAFGVDGFNIRYAGWQGVTLRNCILLPYLFSVLLRKKWALVLLCILAEACITWTLYGLGVGLLVTCVYLLVQWGYGKYAKSSEKEVGV